MRRRQTVWVRAGNKAVRTETETLVNLCETVSGVLDHETVSLEESGLEPYEIKRMKELRDKLELLCSKELDTNDPVAPTDDDEFLNTREFATQMGVRPETVRQSHRRKGHYLGVVPKKLPNNRLRWPSREI